MTPLDIPYNLTGKWKVAVTSILYNGCVNTFQDYDTITVSKKITTIEDLKSLTRPLRIDMPETANTRLKIANLLSTTLTNILEVKLLQERIDGGYFSWKGKNSDFVIILSDALKNLFNLRQSVVSSYDLITTNNRPFEKSQISEEIPAIQLKELFVILVSSSYDARKIVIKAANEHLTTDELIERVNTRIPNAKLELAPSKKHLILQKESHSHVILMCEEFHKTIGFHQAAMYKAGIFRHGEFNFDSQFKNEWSVKLLLLDRIANIKDPYDKIHHLKPKSFKDYKNALQYLNSLNEDMHFSLNEENVLSLEIKTENTKVAFSSILRDCLAFDNDVCKNRGIHKASGVFSLRRRIKYLFIYSNVASYCKVGDAQAPLLGIIPFYKDEGCSLVHEHVFQNPMYIPLRSNHMSHIEVLLTDGTGQAIPFTNDSQSLVWLHFKQV